MLWNRFDNEKEIINPYRNPKYLVSEGLSEYDDLVKAIRENNLKYENEPQNIRQARAVEYYFTQSKLIFDPFNWFGLGTAGWGERVKARIIGPALRSEKYWNTVKDSEVEKMKHGLCPYGNGTGEIDAWLDCDHSTPNWNNLLKLGFTGIINRASDYRAAKRRAGELTADAENFYEGIDIVYDAVLKLLDRFIEYAGSVLSIDEHVPRIYTALLNIRYNPPRTLYEALLFSYLYHWTCEYGECIQVRSLGNMDDIFRPYYESDIENGVLAKEQAKELIKYYFYTFARQANYFGQPAALGGTLTNGETAVNELTYVMLEAYDECDIISPKMQMLVAKNTPDAFVRKCLDMTRRGHSSMVFLNEDLGREIFAKYYDKADLEYTRIGVSGCYNFAFDDLMNGPSHTRINLPKILDKVFMDEEELVKADTFDDFVNLYIDKFNDILEKCVLISDFYDSIAVSVNPSNIYSGSSVSALEKARDMFGTGAKYNDTVIIISCPATVFDSLAMVKKYVYDAKALSVSELKKALDGNWEGFENLRRTIMLDCDKWGNNIKWVDDIAVETYGAMVNNINARKNKRGGRYITCGDTIHYDLKFAPFVGATPDGRKAGEPLSKGLIANRGQDRQGITAVIHSVAKLPSVDIVCGAPFDYMIHPTAVQGEDGLTAMTGIARTFFELGGYSFMGNIIDAQTMIQAKQDPESYKNLQVRLCGWNVYFNDLTDIQKELLIRQASAT